VLSPVKQEAQCYHADVIFCS